MGGSLKSLIVAGQGIRFAGQIQAFREAAGVVLPVVTTWLAADLLPTDHPNNIGIIGPCGQPGANRALHEADEILVWGASMSIAQLGAHHPKGKRVTSLPSVHQWEWEEQWAKREDVPLIGSYAYNNAMTRLLPEGTCMVVDGGGTALYTGFQSSYIKEGSRLLCSSSMSAMGSGLGEAIGACLANGRKLTTCLIGDGSLMLNVQELQTISTLKLPIKIFVISNGGYLAIRQTQKAFQDGRYYGVGGDDLQFPSLTMVANTFDITFALAPKMTRECHADKLQYHLENVLGYEGPVLTAVECATDQPMLRQGFKEGKALPLTEMVLE